MILGVDIGGTKTLLGSFSDSGELTQQIKFETSQNYNEFLENFEASFKQLDRQDFAAAAVAVPGRLDREHGRALGFGTLLWPEVPIESDIERIIDCPVSIENDAKLAGLSEAILIKNDFKKILFVTIGTGISDALIIDGNLDPAMIDSEGGQIWVDHNGKRIQWEDLVSGRAIVERFGKKASDITDESIWKTIASDLSQGLLNLIAVTEPEVIIIGGGVGAHFDKFETYLNEELKKYETALVPIPPIKRARRPEEAVIYGCYELAKQKYGNNLKQA